MFPHFAFKFNELSSLSDIVAQHHETGRRPSTISFLAAVLEVDGPASVLLKRGPEAGKDVAVLNLIVAEDQSSIMKLTAWREVAEDMSGFDEANKPKVKQGDIVFFQSRFYSLMVIHTCHL
jgi:hypothetical protein